MNKLIKILPLLATCVGLVGCQDEDFGYTASEIKYKTEFTKAFGNIDPNQDWNLLAQLANSDAETRALPSKTTPVGEFKITVLPESQAAPLTTEQMKAYSKMLPESNQGGAPYDKTNLGRVTQDFSAVTKKVVLYPVYWWTSATDEIGIYYYSNESGSVSVSGTDGKTYKIVKVPITDSKPEELELSYEATTQWDEVYGTHGTGKEYYEAHQSDLVTNYPDKYKFANGSDLFDEYGNYIVSGKFVTYKGKKSLSNATNAGPANTEFDYWGEISGLSDVWADLATLNPSLLKFEGGKCYYATSIGGTRWTPVSSVLSQFGDQTKVDPVIDAANKPEPVKNTSITPTGFRSKGIVVDLPVSMKIGFYITNGSNTMYSEGKLNHKMSWSGHTDEDACYIATYQSEETDAQGKPIRYLAMEDWYNAGDYDLNDIVFRVYGLETVVDNEEITEEGLFVCEDLGAFDFDFNDVVLKAAWKRYYKKTYDKDSDGNVTNVNIAQYPSDELTITGMAAGGHNPSDVYFKTASNTSGQRLGEIHEILRSSAPNVINAGETYGGDGHSFTFEEAQFPEAWDKSSYPNGYVSQMFGEGYLYVIASTTNRVNDPVQPSGAYNNEASHLISSTSYKTRGVPQMMLLPMYYEWCQEDQPIETVYLNFTTWVNDATKTDWITNGKIESLTTDRGVTPQMYDKPVTPSGGTVSTISATPSSVDFYPSQKTTTVSFTYEGSGNITYTIGDGDMVEVSNFTASAGTGSLTISIKSGWSTNGSTSITLDQAANTSYTASQATIDVNYSATDLAASAFTVPESKSILVTTTGGEEIAITDVTGSKSFSASSSNEAVATASITKYTDDNQKVKITPVAAGTAIITVTQAANSTYASSVQTITVTVTKVASNFDVSATVVDLTADGSAGTVTIWSSNTTKPTVSVSETSNATIGEVTGGTQHWGAEHNGQYEWTIEVTPKSTAADGATFTISQEATTTMEGGSQAITVNVAEAISDGISVTVSPYIYSDTSSKAILISSIKEAYPEISDDDIITFNIELNEADYNGKIYTWNEETYAYQFTEVASYSQDHPAKSKISVQVAYSTIKGYKYFGFNNMKACAIYVAE